MDPPFGRSTVRPFPRPAGTPIHPSGLLVAEREVPADDFRLSEVKDHSARAERSSGSVSRPCRATSSGHCLLRTFQRRCVWRFLRGCREAMPYVAAAVGAEAFPPAFVRDGRRRDEQPECLEALVAAARSAACPGVLRNLVMWKAPNPPSPLRICTW